MKAGIVAFTEKGHNLSKKIQEALIDQDFEISIKPEEWSLSGWLRGAFDTCDLIVFVSATGIAVRAIAPLVFDKKTDPAVLVIDHAGNFVISLLSGHIGGANRFALYVADVIGATPVITTASDVDGKFAIDEWAANSGLVIDDMELAKEIAMDILHNIPVGLISAVELGEVDDAFGVKIPVMHNHIVYITFDDLPTAPGELKLIPKRLAVGIGCRRGVTNEKIEKFVRKVFADAHLDIRAIEKIASIDLKKDEEGLIDFAETLEVPFVTFTKDELLKAEGEFPSSEFVESVTGVDNVCQRAAVLASDNGSLLVEKRSRDGVTVSVYARKEVLNVI